MQTTHRCDYCGDEKLETEEFWNFYGKPSRPKKRHGSKCKECKNSYSRSHQAAKRGCERPRAAPLPHATGQDLANEQVVADLATTWLQT